jgi:hypothetical protein
MQCYEISNYYFAAERSVCVTVIFGVYISQLSYYSVNTFPSGGIRFSDLLLRGTGLLELTSSLMRTK